MTRIYRAGLGAAVVAAVVLGGLPAVSGPTPAADAAPAAPSHPQIYATAEDRPALQAKIADESWAGESMTTLEAEIEPLADQHESDPDWITSRMSMFWAEGERYTQVYIADERFDRAEGNAPVPTLRYPAMRIWNDNRNAPLEQRIPFSEDGSMMNQNGEVVPYEETGHMVRLNNEEIVVLGQKAAFLHFVTGDEKYAAFAADIYWQWLLGVYYMNPALDPGESLGGPGGYEAGGIGGYYDYEVIHDPIGGQAAVIYDFLYDYLNAHPDEGLSATGKTLTEVSNEVSKRFIDIGLVRGHPDGNWNVNGWYCIMPAILSLESNDHYADGHGKEYYLEQYTTRSTEYHQALPEILKEYDPVTGLWHESPGYSLGTVTQLLDFAVPVREAGVDTIAANPVLQKAALAMIPWLDGRGNMVVFGDGRGGAPSYAPLERLNSYYQSVGDVENAKRASEALQNASDAGQYDRSALGWLDILDGAALLESDATAADVRTAWSAHHQHVTMKNGNEPDDGLMATLYGGATTDHLNPNGLAAQIYAKGWAIAPSGKSYESYWSEDYAYSSGPAGSNTVLPGYRSGPVTVNAMEPAVPDDSFTNTAAISPEMQFSDISADEKRRQLAIVRTSPTTGFYVDVFRSDQDDNDYLWHNLGDRVDLLAPDGSVLPTTPSDTLGTEYDNAYRYFESPRSLVPESDVRARWTIDGDGTSPSLTTDMWMLEQGGREVFAVDAPPTTDVTSLTPGGVNTDPDSTPTLVVRQDGVNAATSPFVSVFESHEGADGSVGNITDLGSDGAFVGVQVASTGDGIASGRVDRVLSSSDDALHEPADGIAFRGAYGVATADDAGFASLYLGSGHELQADGYALRAPGDDAVAAGLVMDAEGLRYSSDGEIELTLPIGDADQDGVSSARLQYETADGWVDAVDIATAGSSVTGTVPAGESVAVRVAAADVVDPGVPVDPVDPVDPADPALPGADAGTGVDTGSDRAGSPSGHTASDGSLAWTGSNLAGLLALVAGLLVVGTTFLVVSRRRRRGVSTD